MMSTNTHEAIVINAREVSPLVALDVDNVTPLASLASIASTHTLRVEVVREGEDEVRARMRCACGRSSYFATIASESVVSLSPLAIANVSESSPLVVALRRHVRRVEGRAMRTIRANPRLASRLASLNVEGVEGVEVASDEASEESASLATFLASHEGDEGATFARVRGGGASVHLTRDALVTLCARDASSMSEVASDDEHATCRTCEARAREEESASE